MRSALLECNCKLLREVIELVETIDRDSYATPISGGAAAIGEHLRHVLDFYHCFLRDLPRGRIDYDDRPRDPRASSDPLHAQRIAAELLAHLESFESLGDDQRVLVKADAPEGFDSASVSSVERELQFLASHTVHHHAFIAIALRSSGRPVPEGFGVAPSTQRYWKECAAQSG
jgi:uncharacterized damage-inducible protein DinB